MFICVHLFFESSSIFSRYFCIDVFGITWKVTCSKRFTQLKDLWWVIVGYFGAHLVVFLYLLTAIKPFPIKFCEYVFCVAYLMHRKQISYFLGLFCRSIFWELFGFLWNFAHIFLIILWWLSDKKNFMGTIALCLGLFWIVLFWAGGGRRTHFQYFSLFLEKALVYFHETLQKRNIHFFSHLN